MLLWPFPAGSFAACRLLLFISFNSLIFGYEFIIGPFPNYCLVALQTTKPMFESISKATHIEFTIFDELSFPLIQVISKIANIFISDGIKLTISIFEPISKLPLIILMPVNIEPIFTISPVLNHTNIYTSCNFLPIICLSFLNNFQITIISILDFFTIKK